MTAGPPLPAPLPAPIASVPDNPCLSCGACCASFRVDFSCEELQSRGGSVPDGLAVELSDHTARMRGSDHQPPRCAALVGQVGLRASCGIHEWRPGPCREFALLAPLGRGDEACTRARARHGLAALG
jgi:Fe-S-cluster containining protein